MYETYTMKEVDQAVKDSIKTFKKDYPSWEVRSSKYSLRIPWGYNEDGQWSQIEIKMKAHLKGNSKKTKSVTIMYDL
jgi:hypothetical protein